MRPSSALALAAAAAAIGCGKKKAAPPAAHSTAAPSGPIAVPAARAAIPIDGEWEADWNTLAPRVVLQAKDGGEARPYSEVRFLREPEDGALVLGLYAADEDIRTTDAFQVELGPLKFAINSKAEVTPAIAGAKSAVDLDEGTRDVPGDYDEEWKIELAIPLAALGPRTAPLPIRVSRCDTTKDGALRCGAWHGVITLP